MLCKILIPFRIVAFLFLIKLATDFPTKKKSFSNIIFDKPNSKCFLTIKKIYLFGQLLSYVVRKLVQMTLKARRCEILKTKGYQNSNYKSSNLYSISSSEYS